MFFMASSAKDLLQGFDVRAWRDKHRFLFGLAILAFTLVLAGSILRTSLGTQAVLAEDAWSRNESGSSWTGPSD